MPRSLPSPDGDANANRASILTRRQKAAVLIRLLLKEGAVLDLNDLPESLQVELTHEMGALRMVDRETLDGIVREFLDDLGNLGASFGGGLESALDLLGGALSDATLRRLRRETGVIVQGDPWSAVAALDAEALAALAARESTETMAVVLSKLPVAKSAEMLARLPAERAHSITEAVTATGAVDPETVRTIGHALASQIAEEVPKAFDIAPVTRIGAILNNSTAETREGVLDALSEGNAELGEEIRREIFTFANIADRVSPADVPKVVRAVDQTVLVTAMAGATADALARSAEFVLSNMSKRMAAQLREDVADLGTVKPAAAEAAMADVVAAVRDMHAAGEIELASPVPD